jgi:hypothetical protein
MGRIQGFLRRGLKNVLLASIVLCMSIAAMNAFAQSYQSLTDLLIDLSGWSAGSAEGMDMDMSGMKSVTAARDYEQGDKSISAAIIAGFQMQGMWNPVYQEGFRMDTTQGTIAFENIKGFGVVHTFDKENVEGLIVVLIREPSPDGSGGAVFAFEFEGMTMNEALKLSQKFDWASMKGAVSKLW